MPPPAAMTETDAPPDTLGIRTDEGAASVTLPGFTFDFTKVANRATLLFPFLTGSRSLDRVTAPARSRSRKGLPNPLAQPPAGDDRPPLVLGDAALQSVVDKAWSRRDRWRVFHTIAGLADAHSPTRGRLPALLGACVAQNGLQSGT